MMLGTVYYTFRAVSVIASQNVSTLHIGLIHLLINLLDSAQQDCEEKHLIYSTECASLLFYDYGIYALINVPFANKCTNFESFCLCDFFPIGYKSIR